jgi:phage/plasmid-associated DNA primase
MIFKNVEKALLEELHSLGARLAEDRIYEKVMSEVENDELDAVAKAKAFEEAEGDASKARAFYIKHRVRRIRDLAAEYEIWHQQEADRKEAVRKQELQLADHRRMLSEKMKADAMPPREIQEAYQKEFSIFYSEWILEEYARKYMPKSSAWRRYLLSKGLID